MIQKSDIHFFIPAYNEARAIAKVLEAIQQKGFQNIHVVDDGSKDDTTAVAKAAGVHVIRHLINRGAGAATQTAIEWARKADCSFMILMDADGQHLADDIEVLVERMAEADCDIVIGSRFKGDPSAMPGRRRWYNQMANLLTNVFCKNRYTDTQSGFRMLNRTAIESMQLSINGYGFCSEMLIRAEQQGLQVEEVPTRTVYTNYSLNKGQNMYTGIETAFNLIWKIIFK